MLEDMIYNDTFKVQLIKNALCCCCYYYYY